MRGVEPSGSYWLARRYGSANVLTLYIGMHRNGFKPPSPLKSRHLRLPFTRCMQNFFQRLAQFGTSWVRPQSPF